MEEVREHLKQEFKKSLYSTEGNKIAYVVGFMQNNKKVNKQQALQIIYEILQGRV